MMEVFDLHADIGFDVMQKRRQGKTDILKNYHIDKWKNGGIMFVSMASNFEGNETWEDMQTMILSLKEEIAACDMVDLVLTRDDLLNDNGHIKAVLSVEGMCGIRHDVSTKVEWLYQQGVRIASLCWNDENALASGVRGNEEHGLSALGRIVIEKMMDLHMAIDVSHANEKTFWDIMDYKEAIVLDTHANVRNLCDHPRNLWDAQIQAVVKHQGLLGVVSAPNFVSVDKQHQDIPHMVEHIEYLAQFAGLENIALGMDYMDFYPDCEDYHVKDLKDASYTQNLLQALLAKGWPTQDVMAVACGNAIRFLFELLE